MQQIRKPIKYKSVQKLNAFVSVDSAWCTIADVKITAENDLAESAEEIRELLENSDKDNGLTISLAPRHEPE